MWQPSFSGDYESALKMLCLRRWWRWNICVIFVSILSLSLPVMLSKKIPMWFNRCFRLLFLLSMCLASGNFSKLSLLIPHMYQKFQLSPSNSMYVYFLFSFSFERLHKLYPIASPLIQRLEALRSVEPPFNERSTLTRGGSTCYDTSYGWMVNHQRKTMKV